MFYRIGIADKKLRLRLQVKVMRFLQTIVVKTIQIKIQMNDKRRTEFHAIATTSSKTTITVKKDDAKLGSDKNR